MHPRRLLPTAAFAGLALAAGLPLAAHAQPVTGPYVNLGLGADWLSRLSAHGDAPAFGGAELKGTIGIVGLASAGYGFGNGLRIELEGNVRSHSPDFESFPASGGSAHLNTFGPMVNAIYDFDIGNGWIYPFVGVGVGYEWTRVSDATATSGVGPGTVARLNQSTRGSWGAQGMAGISVPIASVPGLSFTAQYRVMGTFRPEYFGASTTVGVVAGPHTEFKLGDQIHQAGILGLRYVFGVTPPAPPPAPAPVASPAPAPARTYLVFFDWDKADLTDRARQIIADAAQASTHVQTTQIEVDGHADLSGTPQYNQGLSMRRAQAVGSELVKDGVPQNIIMIQAFGDTRPLVPTARGVREPQNRRVEIILK
jgi:OmpA-OmpF porin, OOP family